MTYRRARRGFTLLELLVGMTIFVLIAGTAYAGLRSATRTWEKTDERARMTRETSRGLDYLRRELSTAFPLAVLVDNRWRVWFEGERDRLVFLVEGSRRVGLHGLYQVVVYHNAEASPPSIDLALQRLDDELRIGEIREGAIRRVLIENVAAVEFSFFGRLERREEPAWLNAWQEAQTLPDLVRFELHRVAAGEWPAVTVRLPVDGLRFRRSRPVDGDDTETGEPAEGDSSSEDDLEAELEDAGQ